MLFIACFSTDFCGREFTRRAVKNWKVAPTEEQLKEWYTHLKVYCKTNTPVSKRKGEMVRQFKVGQRCCEV